MKDDKGLAHINKKMRYVPVITLLIYFSLLNMAWANPFAAEIPNEFEIQEIHLYATPDGIDIHMKLPDNPDYTSLMYRISNYIDRLISNSKPINFNKPIVPENVTLTMATIFSSLGEVAYHFLKGMMPNSQEAPNLHDRLLDQFTFKIHRHVPVKAMIVGAGNLKWLGAYYFYNEFKGGLGFEISMLPAEYSSSVLSFRLIPVYGEVLSVRTAYGVTARKNVPRHVILGPVAGLEFYQDIHHIGMKPGFRLYVHPQWNMTEDKKFGTSVSSAVFVRWNIMKLIEPDRPSLPDINISALFHVFDRGQSKGSLYTWTPPEGALLKLRQIRTFKKGFELLFGLQLYY